MTTVSSADSSPLTVLRSAPRQAGTAAEYWSTDWYQAGISRPDIVVEDLFGYLHPDAATPGRASHFFRNIAVGELPRVRPIGRLTRLDAVFISRGAESPCSGDCSSSGL
jgi:hypothetical protein